MNLVFVMEHNRLLRGNVRGRQWQQSLALDLANCHKDCRKNEQLLNVCQCLLSDDDFMSAAAVMSQLED